MNTVTTILVFVVAVCNYVCMCSIRVENNWSSVYISFCAKSGNFTTIRSRRILLLLVWSGNTIRTNHLCQCYFSIGKTPNILKLYLRKEHDEAYLYMQVIWKTNHWFKNKNDFCILFFSHYNRNISLNSQYFKHI